MKLGRPRAHWIKYPTGQRLALAITTKREQGTVAIGQTRLRLASRVDASKEIDLRLPSRRMTRYEARFHINSGGHDNLNRRLFFVLIASRTVHRCDLARRLKTHMCGYRQA